MKTQFKLLAVSVMAMMIASCGSKGSSIPSGSSTGGTDTTVIPDEEYVKVTFDANGGSFSDGTSSKEVQVKKGAEVSEPEAPSKDFYEFVSWQKDGADFTFAGFSVTEDITLTATWNALTTINYGIYPQTLISDEALISELNKLTDVGMSGYYEYEGTSYAKVTGNPRNTLYTFDDGTYIVKGNTYWFRCDPIEWKVLSSKDGRFLVTTEMLLDCCQYTELFAGEPTRTDYKGDTGTAPLTNYKYSDLRTYLNTTFYDKAFFYENSSIMTASVDNSESTTNGTPNTYACEKTSDKIFALSYQELTNPDYGFSDTSDSDDAARSCKTTEYARAIGAYANRTNNPHYGYYYTRSPAYDDPECVCCTSDSGIIFFTEPDDADNCIRPAMYLVSKTTGDDSAANPVLSEDGKTITYGLYPQTHVSDSALIETLDATSDVTAEGYYSFGGNYYAKVTGTPNPTAGVTYEFDDGTSVVKDETYWFKCEPIEWKVLGNSGDDYFITTEKLLDAHLFNTVTGSSQSTRTDYKGESAEVYANNYKYSELRTFLNTDFIDKAFFLGSGNIKTTAVDNSITSTNFTDDQYCCANTNDKVFALSQAELTSSANGFDSNESRTCVTTDYARAVGALTASASGNVGQYFTRTPYPTSPIDAVCTIPMGSIENQHTYVTHTNYGVRPAMHVSLSESSGGSSAYNPKLSEDGKTLTYGMYPQTHVSDSTTIAALNAIGSPDSAGYYEYDGNYYAKTVASPSDASYTYSDGTAVVEGETCWFKCEPLEWKVLSNVSGNLYVVCSKVIDTCDFGYKTTVAVSRTDYEGNTAEVYSNNYKYSILRTFLNTNFYESAFFLDNDNIKTSVVDNSAATTSGASNTYACENTYDNITALSYSEMNDTSYFEYSAARKCQATDYFKAKHNFVSNVGNAYYWTRSPSKDYTYRSWVIVSDGSVMDITSGTNYGVRPAMHVSLSGSSSDEYSSYNPKLSADGKTVTYGIYPQTHVSDSTTISALSALKGTGASGYYEYGGNYYAKVDVNEDALYSFDDGTSISAGNTYWFKCEPLEWKVLSNSAGDCYVVSSKVIDASIYGNYYTDTSSKTDYETYKADVYANNYRYSTLRTFLNMYFFKKAFFLNNSMVKTAEYDNSAATTLNSPNDYACVNTKDKIAVLSYSELNDSSYFASSTDRKSRATDYVRALGVYATSDGYSSSWTRSPSNSYSYGAWCSSASGDMYDVSCSQKIGVRPVMHVKIA